jgi:hypothetical protein
MAKFSLMLAKKRDEANDAVGTRKHAKDAEGYLLAVIQNHPGSSEEKEAQPLLKEAQQLLRKYGR